MSSLGGSASHVQRLLGVTSEAAMGALLRKCPEVAELEPELLMSRLTGLKDHCPNLLTLTDLVFLEPKLLLMGDPLALGTRTWQAIRQVADSICQLMTWQGTHRTPHTAASWQGAIRFCDTVPYVDRCYVRMDLLKTESPGWDYKKGMEEELAWALMRRMEVAAAEQSLRDTLAAHQDVPQASLPNVQLSQGALWKLKLAELQSAVSTLPPRLRPIAITKMLKAELIQLLCEMLHLPRTHSDNRVKESRPAVTVQLAAALQGSEHDAENLHRIMTMSDSALRQQIKEIQEPEELLSFLQMLQACGRPDLAEEATAQHQWNEISPLDRSMEFSRDVGV